MTGSNEPVSKFSGFTLFEELGLFACMIATPLSYALNLPRSAYFVSSRSRIFLAEVLK